MTRHIIFLRSSRVDIPRQVCLGQTRTICHGQSIWRQVSAIVIRSVVVRFIVMYHIGSSLLLSVIDSAGNDGGVDPPIYTVATGVLMSVNSASSAELNTTWSSLQGVTLTAFRPLHQRASHCPQTYLIRCRRASPWASKSSGAAKSHTPFPSPLQTPPWSAM